MAGQPFVSMGIVHVKGGDAVIYRHRSTGSYRKPAFDSEGTRLAGAAFVGSIASAGQDRHLIRKKLRSRS